MSRSNQVETEQDQNKPDEEPRTDNKAKEGNKEKNTIEEPRTYPDGYARVGIVSPEIAVRTARETLSNSSITYTITRVVESIDSSKEVQKTTYSRIPNESITTVRKTTPTTEWVLEGNKKEITYGNNSTNVGSEQAVVAIALNVIMKEIEPIVSTIKYQFTDTTDAELPWSPTRTMFEYKPVEVVDKLGYESLGRPIEVEGIYSVALDGLLTAQTTLTLTGALKSERISVTVV